MQNNVTCRYCSSLCTSPSTKVHSNISIILYIPCSRKTHFCADRTTSCLEDDTVYLYLKWFYAFVWLEWIAKCLIIHTICRVYYWSAAWYESISESAGADCSHLLGLPHLGTYWQHPGRAHLLHLGTHWQHPGRAHLLHLGTHWQHPGRAHRLIDVRCLVYFTWGLTDSIQVGFIT